MTQTTHPQSTGDHEIIWLQPRCCEDGGREGRLWCEDNTFDCDEGVPATKYIRADLVGTLSSENARLTDRVKVLEAALEFYADPQTYHAVAFMADPPCGDFIDDFSEDHGDEFYERPMPGKLARTTLTHGEGK